MIEEWSDRLRIEKLIDEREKQPTFTVRSILENHTWQKKKPQALWNPLQSEDFVLIQDFERKKYYGQKLNTYCIDPQILTKITSSGVSGFVQKLYSKKIKKYYLDDLKTYCPWAKNLL